MSTAGWIANEEKLLCLLLIDDSVAHELSYLAGPAFWRGFVVENRVTGEVCMRQRFKYKTHTSWSVIRSPGEYLPGTIAALMVGALACKGIAADKLHSFYPPDDDGDPFKTIEWLTQRDLIEEKVEA